MEERYVAPMANPALRRRIEAQLPAPKPSAGD
jgi:hypothetical protein